MDTFDSRYAAYEARLLAEYLDQPEGEDEDEEMDTYWQWAFEQAER